MVNVEEEQVLEEHTQEDSFDLFGKGEWGKQREPEDEFSNIFEEELVIKEKDLIEANMVDAGAAKEL